MMTIFVCFFVFLAGFMDSIAGGGGLISLPAYLMTGYPIHLMLGTNKSSSALGTLVATANYVKGKQVHLKAAMMSALFSFIGSYLGASFSLLLDVKILKMIVLILLPVICVFLSKRMKKRNHASNHSQAKLSKHYLLYSACLGLGVGFYDGMLGPGTGTFLIIGYTAMGFSMTMASGNAKIVNLSSNIAAFLRYFLSGNILWMLGIPAAICGILGNTIGSKLALKEGEKLISPLIYVMSALLFVTFLGELIGA